jgi:hypothetical protein
MKMNLKLSCLLGVLLVGTTADPVLAQTFIQCGAEGTTTGAKLSFVNRTNIDPASGFVQPLYFTRVANRYGTNFVYTSTNLVFTALSSTNPAGAAAGSYLVAEIMSVAGPAGATFYFWEQGNGRPTYTFPVGGTYPAEKSRFIVSNVENGAGQPGGDPAGVIRGRRLVVDKAGEYDVTYRLIDTSKNHPTLVNTPIHAPSDPVTIKFSTGLDLGITRITTATNALGTVSTLVFKNGAITNLFVEASTNLVNWEPIVGPFATLPVSLLTTNVFTNNVDSMYYRLRGVTPL